MRHILLELTLTVVLLLPFSAMSHHSGPAVYNPDKIGEIEGVLTKMLWRNPHISFNLAVPDENGQTTSWLVEGGSPARLQRRGVEKDFLKIGDTIKIAGQLARSGEPRLRVTNVLLPTGEELLTLSDRAPLRWNTNEVIGKGNLSIDESVIKKAREDAYSIFRVWMVDFKRNVSPSELEIWKKDYPLTEFAAKYRAEYDPDKDASLAECNPPGMPTVMSMPYPLDFTEEGDTIVFRQEVFDSKRIIHMAPDAAAKASMQIPSILGYSVGHWEEDKTLVVETSKINWPYFDQRGLPQGKNVTTVERFILSEDESRLDYELVVTDPATFTEPVTLSTYWVWLPGEAVGVWDCQMYDPIQQLLKNKMQAS
ncbi:MAG: hypothetical protein HOK08_00035 [Betaproteobacteria bacterium]|jgi:hypothetical protein|nr:hypothetical protein [Betaproteobacteria bacterium]